jgi:hypothetical protein
MSNLRFATEVEAPSSTTSEKAKDLTEEEWKQKLNSSARKS